MTKFLQTLIDGISVGSLYALIALGYTMVYGTLKFINFAHASVFMLGAWVSYTLATAFGYTGPNLLHAFIIITLTMLICATLGFTIERLAYRPLRDAARLNVLITAIGVALLLENTSALPKIFGMQPAKMVTLLPDVRLYGIQLGAGGAAGGTVWIQLVDVLILGLSLTLMGLLQFIIFNTKLGSAMRAASHDVRTAALMGVPVDRTISITFVIGSALAAAAGFLYVMKYPGISPPANTTWALLGLKAFVAAVVGGIGNIRGAMVGGLLIGLLELFGAGYLSPHYRDAYVFALLIAVLLIRPTGIFGSTAIEKV